MSLLRLLCGTCSLKNSKCTFLSIRHLFTNNFKQSSSVLNVNTNVVKDVVLFKYDNPRYFKYLTFFGLSQFGFWMYLCHFSYTTLRDVPIANEDKNNPDLPWWRKINLGEQKYRNGISLACGIIGYMFLSASFAYTIRSVRFLILRKGGKTLSFVTYGPFGLKNAIMDVPLSQVCAVESRANAKVQLPIKVRGKWLYFMLDMRGEFRNPILFDSTAGLRRNIF